MTLGRLFEPYVIQILPLLLVCYGDSQREVRDATNDACKAIVSKLSGHCVKLVMPSLLNGLDDKTWRTKTGSIEVLGSMAALAPKQLSLSLPTRSIIPPILRGLADETDAVRETAMKAGRGVVRNYATTAVDLLLLELELGLFDVKLENPSESRRTTWKDLNFVHFTRFLQGLMYGQSDVREESAKGLGDLVQRTSADGLKAFVTQITGPLIRIIGDRVSRGVKAAILKTLGLLLVKVPANLKPFLPQLQKTFIKSLLQPRLDPLVVELTTGIKTAEDKSVRNSMRGALLSLLNGLEGKETTDVSNKTIETLLVDSLFNTGENDDVVRKCAAKCFPAYVNYLSKDDAKKTLISTKLFSKQVLEELPVAFTKRHGRMEAISRVLVKCLNLIVGFAPFASTAVSKVFAGFQSEKLAVLEGTVSCANSLLVLSAEEHKVHLLTGLIEISKEGVQVDAPRTSVMGIKTLANEQL
ncbi:armadillo-type protein [Chytriomyces cf. hyalinus JEL632]|nr:armadillo-type protein [Chytriomyces cf. hyalinus JEL632]